MEQGILQVKSFKTSHSGRGPHYGTPQEHIDILQTAKKAISALSESPLLLRHAHPILCHPDFHPGNIFVSEDDPTQIVNVIDWQFTNIMPRFTQVRWPLFLAPPEGYRTGMSSPELPPEYPENDAEEHTVDSKKQADALRTKCYEAALVKTHLESYLALTKTDVSIRQLFTSCSSTYREGINPLRDSLIKIFRNWSRLGLQGSCPFSFTDKEISRHEAQIKEYREWLKMREYTHELLRSNDAGWVPPQVNFEEAQANHRKLYRNFLHTRRDKTEEEAKKLWFFRERG